MNRTRTDIQSDIKAVERAIAEAKVRLRELVLENILFSDDQQWFTEKEEEEVVSKRPKKIEKFLVGRIHWKETFTDMDKGTPIEIERSRVVRVNGEWR